MPHEYQLNERQKRILAMARGTDTPLAVSDFWHELTRDGFATSRITVIRDLGLLTELKLLRRSGKGRGTIYSISPTYDLIAPIDTEAYFAVETDKRDIKQIFNFEIFSLLKKSIWEKEELERLHRLHNIYLTHIKQLPPDAMHKEFERLTIDLSWKSSQIEGNTYTLLETEYLLKEHIAPKGHTQAETQMILNHKTALEYVSAHAKKFKQLHISDIEDVHKMLVEKLDIEKNMRNRLVRITGTAYRPLDNVFQIRDAMEQMCQLINMQNDPFSKALLSSLLIAYIQPFTDGNKRTSRLIGNAMLLAHGACPLSYRSADELQYKKAVILFYEQNNITYFKQLFLEQFAFAVKNYFG